MTDNLIDKEEFGRKGGKKEKPFTMKSWGDLEQSLADMKPRTKLYDMVKKEIEKRGHWRLKPRGVSKVDN